MLIVKAKAKPIKQRPRRETTLLTHDPVPFGTHDTHLGKVVRERIAKLRLPDKDFLDIYLWDKANNQIGDLEQSIDLTGNGRKCKWVKDGNEFRLWIYAGTATYNRETRLTYKVGVKQEDPNDPANGTAWCFIGSDDVRGASLTEDAARRSGPF